MKFIPLFILGLFFFSCQQDNKLNTAFPPEKSKQYKVQLADSLGFLTLMMPQRFDTFFSWTHYSDCGRKCDKIKYRFQPKNFPLNKENGWYWKDPKDSVFRFTIEHSGYFPYQTERDSTSIYNNMKWREELLGFSNEKILFDTVEKINDRYFSMFIKESYDSTQKAFSKLLCSTTSVYGNFINLDFEMISRDSALLKQQNWDDFKYFLRTIRFSGRK